MENRDSDEVSSSPAGASADANEAAEFTALLKQINFDGPDAKVWLDRLEQEHDRLRAALSWILQRGNGEQAVALGALLWRFWMDRGHFREGRQWLDAILRAPGAEARTAARAKTLYGAGVLAFRQGDQRSARTFYEESLAISRELSDRRGIALALMGLARVALRDGEYTTIRELSKDALAIYLELGDEQGTASPLHLQAAAARMEGDYARAEAYYRENLALNRGLGNERWVNVEIGNLGAIATLTGDLERASALCRESLVMSSGRKDMYLLPYDLLGVGGVEVARGNFEQGVRLLGAAEAQFEATGAAMDPDSRADYERFIAATRAGLNEDQFARFRTEGRAMTLEQAIEYGLSVVPK